MVIKNREELKLKVIEYNKKLDSIQKTMDKQPWNSQTAFDFVNVIYEHAYILDYDNRFYLEDREIITNIIDKFQNIMGIRLYQLVIDEDGINAQALYEYYNKKIEQINDGAFVLSEEMQDHMRNLCRKNFEMHNTIRNLRVENKRDVPILNDKENNENYRIIRKIYTFPPPEEMVLNELIEAYGMTLNQFDVVYETSSNQFGAIRGLGSKKKEKIKP